MQRYWSFKRVYLSSRCKFELASLISQDRGSATRGKLRVRELHVDFRRHSRQLLSPTPKFKRPPMPCVRTRTRRQIRIRLSSPCVNSVRRISEPLISHRTRDNEREQQSKAQQTIGDASSARARLIDRNKAERVVIAATMIYNGSVWLDRSTHWINTLSWECEPSRAVVPTAFVPS